MLYTEVLAKTAIRYAEKVALIFDEKAYTFRDVQGKVDKIAAGLAHLGLNKGDFACSYLPNSLENLLLSFAFFKLGVISVPIRNQIPSEQVAYIVKDAKPKLIVTNGGLVEKLNEAIGAANDDLLRLVITEDEALPEGYQRFADLLEEDAQDDALEMLSPVQAEDIATVLYTSGSTGDPKGAMHQHKQWLHNASIASEKNFEFSDVTLVALSINHCYGFGEQVLAAWLKGATILLESNFEAKKFLSAIQQGVVVDGQRYVANYFCGVPSMYQAIALAAEEEFRKNKGFDYFAYFRETLAEIVAWAGLNYEGSLLVPFRQLFNNFTSNENQRLISHRLKCLDYAGDILPEVVQGKIISLFGTGVLRPSYGMTEATCISDCSDFNKGLSNKAVIGKPRDGVLIKLFDPNTGEEVPVGDVGELCIKSPSLCVAYLNSDLRETNTINGYFRTGDAVRLTEDGQLIYVNHIKRLIISEGAYNVNPRELEDKLNAQDGVKASCVFDIHDERGLGVIIALAIASQSETGLTASNLFHLFDGLHRGHRPDVVKLQNEPFKLGSTGKINWRFYQEQGQEEFARTQPNTKILYDSRPTL